MSSTLENTIIRAKEQLLRDQILKAIEEADTWLSRATAFGAWENTIPRETWKQIQEARIAIDAAALVICGQCEKYEDEAGELLPAMPRKTDRKAIT